MRLRPHRPPHAARPGLADDWVERVALLSETNGISMRWPAEELISTLVATPRDTDAALRTFGRQAGNAGWSLTETASWLDDLLEQPGRHRLRLERFEAGLALADGWMEGVQHALGTDAIIDPLTGLVTPAVLELRLREVVAHCRSLGIDPAAAYNVGVIDVDLAGTSPLVRDAARVVVADHALRRFTSGETLCTCGDRILALASATPSFAAALDELAESLAEVALLQRSPALVWVEPLPSCVEHVETFVVDLCC